MTRELTKEQADFVLRLNSPEWREAARKQQEEEQILREARLIEYKRKLDEYLARAEEKERARREAMQPLWDALSAAGIKLSMASYEGIWGSYQIGDGPVVDFDLDDADTFRGTED